MAGKRTQFKNGHPGGPGRPKNPPDINRASALTKTTFLAKLKQFLDMDIEELEAVLRNKKMTVADHWVGRLALMGIKTGDERRLNFMADRLFGKVTDKIEHNMLPRPYIIKRPSGEIIELGATLDKPKGEE